MSAPSAVTAVAVADAGSYVAAGTDGGDVLLFDGNGDWPEGRSSSTEGAGGGRYWTKSVVGPVRDLAFAGDGRYLVVGSDRITLFDYRGDEEWDITVQRGSRSGGTPLYVTSVAFTNDGNYIVAGSSSGDILFMNRQGNLIWEGIARNVVTAVDVSRDGSVVAAGGRDRALQVYGRAGGLPWALPTGAPILALALSGDGRFVVVGKEGGDVDCYRPNDDLLWKNRTGSDVLTVDISRRGGTVAAGTAGGGVHLWNNNGDALWSFDGGAAVNAVALSDGGDYLAAGAGERAFIFRTADAPVPAATEDTTHATAPTQAGGVRSSGSSPLRSRGPQAVSGAGDPGEQGIPCSPPDF
ncbi:MULTISPECIES: WD40 repeat domain-containing protein [unclassified Methanoculleus]|uniref:WD40 repeat domain-containing protein n=1 Tax=unclassified Methanoculleus TaxID=2619537 RepID=UPI0025F6EB89|nr:MULTISPECIES: PQQ-binding-like beta-propeller repeat protein [unclassified Methanoculleus]